jgi:malate dehydrogenase (oxaloacetate-decarboxylating)(NADP+)
VFVWESVAVAQAAMQTGSAKVEIDIEEYREKLERRVAGKSSKSKRHTKRKVANR